MQQGWTPFQYGVALLMVVTGSLNTLAAKWSNLIPAENSVGAEVPFNHPFLQSTAMFLGELACLLVFYAQVCFLRNRSKDLPITSPPDEEKAQSSSSSPPTVEQLKPFSWKRSYLLFPAAMFDLMGTSVMYVGLTLTSASSFQMLRGSVIIFTGINSIIFLKRRLEWFKWLGMVVIFGGLVIVGMADFLYPSQVACFTNSTVAPPTGGDVASRNDSLSSSPEIYALEPYCQDPGTGGTSNEVVGDILIICAQVVTSFQMVYEEKVLGKYSVAPLEAVGWEGLFGFVTMSILLVPFAYIDTGDRIWGHSPSPPWVLEDAVDGLVQLGNSGLLVFSFCGLILSIAFFNFAGITVTKELNATTRMVLDSVRTLIIWMVSLGLGWQTFQFLQPIGFVVLILGMCLYNDILILPTIRKYRNHSR